MVFNMQHYAQELFLLMTNLSQLKDKDRIITFLIESLNDIFAGYSFEWISKDENNSNRLVEVCTRYKTYGYIAVTTNNSMDNEIEALLHNTGQMLAIILEKIAQEELLIDQKDHLKLLVDEQTHDLLTSNDAIKSISENIPDVIIRFDNQYRHLFVNSNIYKITGYNVSELIGKSHREIGFPEDLCDYWESCISNVFQTKELFETDFDYQYNGILFTLDWRLIPEFDDYGNVASVLSISRDISEQKRMQSALKESDSLLSVILDSLPDLLWLKDKDGVYLNCNRRFESFFGAKKEEIISKSDYDFLPKELADFFRNHDTAALNAGKPTSNEESVTFAEDGHIEILETIKNANFIERWQSNWRIRHWQRYYFP